MKKKWFFWFRYLTITVERQQGHHFPTITIWFLKEIDTNSSGKYQKNLLSCSLSYRTLIDSYRPWIDDVFTNTNDMWHCKFEQRKLISIFKSTTYTWKSWKSFAHHYSLRLFQWNFINNITLPFPSFMSVSTDIPNIYVSYWRRTLIKKRCFLNRSKSLGLCWMLPSGSTGCG